MMAVLTTKKKRKKVVIIFFISHYFGLFVGIFQLHMWKHQYSSGCHFEGIIMGGGVSGHFKAVQTSSIRHRCISGTAQRVHAGFKADFPNRAKAKLCNAA